MVGLPVVLGGQSAPGEVFVQVPGEGLFLSSAQFRGFMEREPLLMRTLLLYVQALVTQIAQSAACASHHPMTARCARWLLQTHDRVRGNEFVLTHEFLGLMLGVRRATVTVVAHELQLRGLIQYRRGMVTVIDRSGLEKVACECYDLINREYKRLLKSRRSE
jgi:CRP-like cAMP-binding protein